jgi:hypothetical protein
MKTRALIRTQRQAASHPRPSHAQPPPRLGAIRTLQILPVWPKDLADRSRAGREKLIRIIERELRKERRRGQCGECAYDITRHAALAWMLKAERDSLRGAVCAMRATVRKGE